MHKRKQYVVYPPAYVPMGTERFKVARSRGKAFKLARKMGAGSEVHVIVHEHPGPRQDWTSSCFRFIATYEPV